MVFILLIFCSLRDLLGRTAQFQHLMRQLNFFFCNRFSYSSKLQSFFMHVQTFDPARPILAEMQQVYSSSFGSQKKLCQPNIFLALYPAFSLIVCSSSETNLLHKATIFFHGHFSGTNKLKKIAIEIYHNAPQHFSNSVLSKLAQMQSPNLLSFCWLFLLLFG